MATKENRRQMKELLEGLEWRAHRGPAVHNVEIQQARELLRQHDFSPASDYFNRLTQLEQRLQGRPRDFVRPPMKRNYGGSAAGYRMQVQSIYDHLILSICYAGEFNTKRGRIKISHRFNREGRIDFVELKFLNALHAPLNGELRKLLTVKNHPSVPKDWFEAEAFVLPVLPQELVFLFADLFRCEKAELFAWLINIGHQILGGLLEDLNARPAEDLIPSELVGAHSGGPETWGRSGRNFLEPERDDRNRNAVDFRSRPQNANPDQLPIEALLQDEIALPIIEKAARLESVVELDSPEMVHVRYLRKFLY